MFFRPTNNLPEGPLKQEMTAKIANEKEEANKCHRF
ncbi:hypothetical protein M493_06895 [Geobacillus genomosp. 3]|uniref:Uncharacterized protein n=1 Tax=Geobacillus genomosp. 3 TaxID=1921421 RepID=S5ZBX4_GEOG3|nr:hypothetical protein M493_06895 [Geobacillus genomosp. 3]